MTYNTRFVFQMKKLYITAPVPLMTKLFPAFTLVQLRSLTGLMHGVNCEKKIEIKWLFGPKNKDDVTCLKYQRKTGLGR